MKINTYSSIGRRKRSVARVFMKEGNGSILINKMSINKYFGLKTICILAIQPLEFLNMEKKFDITINVSGGGFTGQSGAIKLGISRVLVNFDGSLKSKLKKLGYLTRDSRKVERKKVGLRKARKKRQFSKR